MDSASLPLFEGCATALVTPFTDSGDIHTDAFQAQIRRQMACGADALVVGGTTGEAPTLSDREKEQLFRIAVEEVHLSPTPIPVIAGTGSSDTSHAQELTAMAGEIGCDGVLVITPCCNKPSLPGLVRHFERIADTSAVPVILYHVPGRTACHLSPEACRILSDHPRIAGLKDATGDVAFTTEVAALCGDRLPLYAGNDALILPVLSLGGYGVVSVVGNLLPGRVSRLCRLFRDSSSDFARNQRAEALQEQLSLLPLCHALFAEVNPVPVKAALQLCGYGPDRVRLPLTEADDTLKENLRLVLKQYGLLVSP